MKKKFFILAVAAAALASCSSDEVVSKNTTLPGNDIQQKEIAFSPLSRPSTRAAGAAEYNVVEGVSYPQNYKMDVAAYSYVDATHKGDYFGGTYGETFEYQPRSTNGYWAGDDPQYWPLSPATLNFLAVSRGGSPDNSVVSSTFGDGGTDWAKQVSVTLSDNKPQDANEGATTGQHDLMYAFGQASVTTSGNALNFPDNVAMTFNHALAWVYFRVKAGNADSEAISIKNIKLNGAYYAGTFQAQVNNYNTASTLSWNAANTKWTAANTSSDNYSPNFSSSYNYDGTGAGGAVNSETLVNGSFFNVGDGILVVPTSEITPATSSIASFDIEYYLNGNLYTYNYVPAVLTYEKGKKYVYDITMTLHEIFIDASVENWEAGGTEYVDIPTFAAGTTGRTFNIPATAGTYTFRVAGFTGASTPTVSGTLTTTITSATVTVSDYSAGVATVVFTVPANGGGVATGGTIILTDTGDGSSAANNTTVTVSQAY